MTILKSIFLTILSFVIATLLGLLVLSFDNNSAIYPHILGLSEILPCLLTYLLLIIYFRLSKTDVTLRQVSFVKNYWLLIALLISLALGDRLFGLPFFQWKNLSNKYLGTEFKIADNLGYEFSFVKLYFYFFALIIAPIFEEIFFRYYIFGGLLKKYHFLTALLISSILFASIHIQSPCNLIPTFIFGIISAIVYFRTQKIIYSILLHFFTNALWLGTVIFSKQYHDFIKATDFGISFWLVFLFGIFLLIAGIKKITATALVASSKL